ncbi:FIG138928: iron-regulated membrane protein [Pseudoalteromonas luteoviolacea B = ATCC 29581]|nr:FIG138928: iron-regulated membrane protein [Pseudoalteromonas luteoviolacea B = ATCC 29581]
MTRTQIEKSTKKASLLSLHSWSGVVLGMLLYAVIFTGTVAVIAHEIGQWSQSQAPKDRLRHADIDALVRQLAEQTDPKYTEEISITESYNNQLVFFFHTHGTNPSGALDDIGVEYRVNEHNEVVQTRQGFGSELFPTDDTNALGRFLVSIHTELHMPKPWGLILTGILGLAMLVAAVSGILMHRHLFTDIFLLRSARSGEKLKRDAHTVAGTWSLPFAFLLAFTGSFFSFATSFGLPAMAMVAFGGDQKAMIYTLVGEQMEVSETPKETTNLNLMIQDASARNDAAPNNIVISHYNTESASMELFFLPSQGAIISKYEQYNAATGSAEGVKPFVGTEPSFGSLILSLIFPVHYGTFAGLFSKLVWVSLGVASCYVTMTGLQLYAHRRENKLSQWQWLPRFCHWGFIGLPLCSLASAVGFFISSSLGLSTSNWTPLAFVIAAGMVTILSVVVKPITTLKYVLLALTGLMCISLPLIRIALSQTGWISAVQHHFEAVLFVDLSLFVCGALCLYQVVNYLRQKTLSQSTLPEAV